MNTHCLRDRPVSLGPLRVPKKILVVMIRSVRRRLSSRITRPLSTIHTSGQTQTAAQGGQGSAHLELRVSRGVALGCVEPNMQQTRVSATYDMRPMGRGPYMLMPFSKATFMISCGLRSAVCGVQGARAQTHLDRVAVDGPTKRQPCTSAV